MKLRAKPLAAGTLFVAGADHQNEDPNIRDMAYTTMECLKLKGIK